jgi:hypothetical protein
MAGYQELFDEGVRLSEAGQDEAAVDTLAEAVVVSRARWQADRRFAPAYAAALLWLGGALRRLERWDEALGIADLVVVLRRSTAAGSDDPDLAQALCQYATCCVHTLRSLDEAELAIAEAVTIAKARAEQLGLECTAELHGALGVFGAVQLARGDAEEAAQVEAYLASHSH